VSITIKPDQTIKVTIPKRVSLPTAKKFLQTKIPWVKKNLHKLKKLQKNYPLKELLPINKKEAKTILTERLNLLAQKYKFSYNKSISGSVFVAIKDRAALVVVDISEVY
jgi:predicted metal-dependent hydrolase